MEQMVCEVSVLNLFSPKPDIIRLPLSYLYLSSPGTFSRSLGKGYLSSVHTAKGNSGPIWVLCDINHRLSLHGCCCSSATSDSQINTLHFHQAFDGQKRCFHNTDVEEAMVTVCVGVGLCRHLSCSLSHQPHCSLALLKSSGGQ